MSADDYFWEPPLAGTESEQLLGALDRLRTTFRWKADDLASAGLQTRLGGSTMTLGGLLKHLAVVEDVYATMKLTGDPLDGPWDDLGHDGTNDWEFRTSHDDPPDLLYRRYDDAVEQSRAAYDRVIADRGLGGAAHAGDDRGNHASVRRVLCDLIEEYGRHCGHADLIREAVDGRTGEDPPGGWRPVSG